jgi:predicted lactoylglutathione lyase
MINAVFLNMPVQDVARSREFFSALGFSANEQFSGAENVCMVVNSNISLMLMNREKFTSFIDKDVASKSASEIILSFACESEDEVRSISEKAISMGARKVNGPEDNDFMYSWAFEDLDGHLWDLFWLKA